MKTNIFFRHSLTHLFILALGLLMLYPVVWMVVSSFKPNNMIFSDPGLIPKAITGENYITGWRGYAGTTFAVFFRNSLLMCAVAVLGNLISCTMTAYAFARLNFVGRRLWFVLMLVTLMLPAHVTLVPQYILFNNFGWVGGCLLYLLVGSVYARNP
jgi:multiple sugar transport system permease protein